MPGLREKIDTIMAAITFAEEGEFETARTLLTNRQRVLLALQNGRLDRKACTYALNTCQRLGSSLDILVVGDDEQEGLSPALQAFLGQLEAQSIAFCLVRESGCIKRAILRYTAADNDIMFVVIESEDALQRNCEVQDRRLAVSWQKLRCPLVVVAEGLKA